MKKPDLSKLDIRRASRFVSDEGDFEILSDEQVEARKALKQDREALKKERAAARKARKPSE